MARLKRILRHPAAAVGLLVMLGVSVWMLPKDWEGGSLVGSWLGRWYLARPTGPYRPALEVYLVRDGEGFVVHDPNSESFDVISKAINDPSVEVLMGVAGRRSYKEGFYDLTSVHTRHYAHVVPLRDPSTLRAEDLDVARRVLVDWIAQTENGSYQWLADRVRNRDEHTTIVYWPGVAHNAAAIALLAAFVYSLRWNLSLTVWRARRRQARLSRGLCPRCRYSLRGLAENKCPECGEVWMSAEEQAARA